MQPVSQLGVVQRGMKPTISCSSAPAQADSIARVWRLAKTGNIANLKLEESTLTPARPGQARVAVKAVKVVHILTDQATALHGLCSNCFMSTENLMQVGVNFADVFTCLGLYQAAPKENVIPGLEVVSAPASIEAKLSAA